MLNDFTGADKVYIACRYTDLWRGIDGLTSIVQQQFQLDPFTDTLFLFWGIPGREPETERLVRELTRQGKRVGLPRMLPGHQMEVRQFDPRIPMKQAAFGIWEPSQEAPLLEKKDIALALVPAVSYDRRGYRLGFGGGYYDRWLEDFSGRTAGLCRGVLLQEQVPIEGHDARVEVVLTEQEAIWIQT